MKISFITNFILDPDLLLRLKKEGHNITLYEKDKSNTLEGTIKRAPFADRLKNLGDLVIYDLTGNGDEPVQLRKKGYSVIGGSSKSDQMELDRVKGVKIAKLAGIQAPETHSFESIKDIIAFLVKNPKRWVMKQEGDLDGIKGLNFMAKFDDSHDLVEYLTWLEDKWIDGLKQTFVLQEFIKGYEMACGAYWNGKEFLRDKDGDEVCEENMEHKALMPGDMGVSTDEMFTLMRYKKCKESKIFMETLDKMRDVLLKIDFRGNIDINCIVCETGIYFLEWTMRFGSPATPGQTAIHKTGWGEMLKAVADGKQIAFDYDEQWVIAAFLCMPPYPNPTGKVTRAIIEEHFEKNPPKNLDDKKELLEMKLATTEDLTVDFKEKLSKEELDNVHFQYVYFTGKEVYRSNTEGHSLIVTGKGKHPCDAGEATEKLLKKIVVPKGFWRNDFTSHYDKYKDDLTEWGYLEKDPEEVISKIKELVK